MKEFIVEIEVPQKPIDELLTSNNHIVLDFDDLENIDLLTDITIEDIDLDHEDLDLENDDFNEDDFHDHFQDEIDFDDIDLDFNETFE